MAQLREEGALSEEMAYFIRAMLANELSVEVLWKFLETEVPNENDRLSNKWWTSKLPRNLKGFQVKDIKTKQPQEWDMSVLAFAIQNCLNLVQDKKDAVKKMKDKRNDLSHKRRATYAKKEFNQLFIDLDDSYKSLLGEPEARCVSKELKKIKEMRLCVKPFETILAKRDEALGKAKETDEATMLIHTTLLKNCRECAHDVLATDVNWIIGILSHKTTVPKGSDGAGVQADGPDPVQERDKNPVSILKEYCDKNKLVQTEYDSEGGWICTVTIKTMSSSGAGETEEELFEGKMQRTKRGAKRAAAQKAIEKLGIL